VAVFVLVSILGCDKSPQKSPEETGARTIAVADDDWWLLRNEMESHFRQADDLFRQGRLEESAEEIRRGTVFVRIEAGRSEGEFKDGLLQLSSELESLAAGVKIGETTSTENIESLFGQAEYSLSRHHVARADKAYQRGDPVVAGRALKRAANGLERAYRWTGKKIDERTASVLKDTKEVADGIAEGVKTIVDKVNNPVTPISKEFERFGENIVDKRPGKKRDFTEVLDDRPDKEPRKR